MSDSKGAGRKDLSDSQKPDGVNHLLVIAIDEYQSAPRLRNCVRDADSLIDILTSKYGFNREYVKTIFNADATRENILETLHRYRNKVKPGDALLIYFSGHGEVDGEDGFWVPVEAEVDRYSQFISNYDIKQRLDKFDFVDSAQEIEAHYSAVPASKKGSGRAFLPWLEYFHLPTIEALNAGESAYAELLDEVLMDRIVTDAEYESLLSLAMEYGISKDSAEQIHLRYLHNLIRYPLLDDVITETEHSDIRKVGNYWAWNTTIWRRSSRRYAMMLVPPLTRGRRSQLGTRGKSVCFTGALNCCLQGESITRKRAQELAAENGMVIKSGVSKSLDYLVAADPYSQSGKARKARKYEIPVVAEAEFWKMLGVIIE